MAKKEIESINVTLAENGGWTVRESYKRAPRKNSKAPSGMDYEYPQSEEFVFGASEGAKAAAHMLKCCGIKEAAEETGEEEHDGEDED